MGAYLKLVDQTKLYHETANRYTRIVNDQKPSFEGKRGSAIRCSEETRDDFMKLVFSVYEGDVFDNIPTCACENLSKAINIGGPVCPICGTKVEYQVERDLEPILWARAPEGVKCFINPNFWLMMASLYSKDRFNMIQWVADPYYTAPSKKQYTTELRLQSVMEQNGITRGWNSLVSNLPNVLEILNNTFKNKNTKESRDLLLDMLRTIPNTIFTEYLPFPNRSILVLEKNGLGKFAEKSLGYAVDAAMTLYGIDTEARKKSLRVKERLALKTVLLMAEYAKYNYREVLGSKYGSIRRNVFSGRCRFSFRTVATSITAPHHYRQIVIPWGVATSVFAEHIAAKLLRKGWTPREIDTLLNEYALQYNETLARIFDELIEESDYELGIPCTVQRNPTLERGSCQSVFISKIKLPNDPTVSISILIVKGMNGDFDGDELNFTLALDRTMTHYLEEMAPHKSVYGLGNPNEVSGNLAAPKPFVSTKSRWLHDNALNAVDPAKLELMKKFAVN